MLRGKLPLQQPIAFPQKALDSIAYYRIAKFFPGRKADLGAFLHGKNIEHHILVRIGTPMTIDLLEIIPISKYSLLRQSIHPFTSLARKARIKRKKATGVTYILCRKLLSALLASFLDNEPATLSLHSLTESMRLLAPMIIRLIGSFHLLHLLLCPFAKKRHTHPFSSDNYVKLYLLPPYVSTVFSLFSQGFPQPKKFFHFFFRNVIANFF